MSIDNVMAIAGAAQGAAPDHQMPLVIFGLVISVPIIVWGSQLVLKIMDSLPIVITLGAMLLGWIAGIMIWTDPALASVLPSEPLLGLSLRHWAGFIGACLVWGIGRLILARQKKPLEV
jgi:predicted tellurium resistance membrane protein TerC